MRTKTNYLVLHCSDSDYLQHNDISIIRKWHTEERGFSDVGYHFFIQRDGTIQTGRGIDAIGAHCKGINSESIGICLHGKTYFTKEQFEALTRLYKELILIYPDSKIIGHYEKSDKTCPNFIIEDFMDDYYINIDTDGAA